MSVVFRFVESEDQVVTWFEVGFEDGETVGGLERLVEREGKLLGEELDCWEFVREEGTGDREVDDVGIGELDVRGETQTEGVGGETQEEQGLTTALVETLV